MGLTAITIENFKGIGEAVTIPLRPLTLLFGANSAGKSTIIQALQYAWEVLENRNADVDRTRLGGEAIDLGGFKNLVHGHDLSREIRIALHYAGEPKVDPYLPPNNYISEAFGGDYVDGGYISANSYLDIATLSVSIATRWNYIRAEAQIVEYSVSLNGEDFARIGHREGGEVQVKVDAWHSFFTRESRSEAKELGGILADIMYFFEGCDVHEPFEELTSELTEHERKEMAELDLSSSFSKEVWPVLGQPTVVPAWGRQFGIGPSGHADAVSRRGKEEADSLISQLVAGVGEAILDELRGLRYIGPLRVVPNRFHVAPLNPGRERWANGLGAWDTLQREVDSESSGLSLVERCSAYMHETLGLDYTLRREERIQLPADSTLYAQLKLIATQFDEHDERDLRRVIEQIEALPRMPVVQLHDEKNDIDVEPMDVGVGVSQVLPVIVGAVEPHCNILAIEQPELHVPPAVQSRLGDLFIRECIPSQPGPVFLLETHSEHLILRILRRIRECTDGALPPGYPAIYPDDVQVVYVENKDGKTIITPLKIASDGDFSQDWPNGFFNEREEDLF
jgi:hypothetical protein